MREQLRAIRSGGRNRGLGTVIPLPWRHLATPRGRLLAEFSPKIVEERVRIERLDARQTRRPRPEERRRGPSVGADGLGGRRCDPVVEEDHGVDSAIAGELLGRVLGSVRPEHFDRGRDREEAWRVGIDREDVEHPGIMRAPRRGRPLLLFP